MVYAWCVWGLSACGVTVHAQRLSAVKKVALIGFSARLSREQKNNGMGVVQMVDTAQSLANDDKIPTEKQASIAYAQCAQKLHDAFDWTVLSEEDVSINAAYRTLWEKHSQKGFSGLQTALSKFDQDYNMEHVLWSYRADGMSYADKKALLEALGVDAVAVVNTEISVSGSWGIGAFTSENFRGVTSFKLFDAVDEKPIWKDPYAKGKSTKSASTFRIAGIDLGDDKATYFLQAIDRSYDALIERNKEKTTH